MRFFQDTEYDQQHIIQRLRSRIFILSCFLGNFIISIKFIILIVGQSDMVPDRTRTDRNQSSGDNPSPGGQRYSTGLLNRRECLKLGAAAAAIAGGIGVGTSAATAERAHDIEFDTVIDAVADAGMDPTGETPIDDQLDSVLESNTLVRFPAGEYLLTDEHILTGVSNVGIQGRGDSPSDVRFVFPEGNSGAPDATDYVMFWIEANSGVLLENFEIDQTSDRRTGASVVVSADDKLVVQDLSWQGFNPAVSDANEACLHSSVTSADGSGQVTGLTIDGGGVASTYPGCRVGVAVRGVHEGDLLLANLDVRELGAPALRATNCPGAVRVEDSHFENNDNGNVLFGGGRDGRSYLKGCTVVVDESRIRYLPSDERYENLEGVRIDAGGQGWTGVTIEDCQFLFESFPDGATGRAVISRPTVGDHGAFTVRNSTLSVNTPGCVPVYAASPGHNLTRSSSVSLENVHITGTQSSNNANSVVFIEESDGSTVSDCCIGFLNGLDGVRIDRSRDCSVVESDIKVGGRATSFSDATVATRDLTSTGACQVVDLGEDSDGSSDGSDTTDGSSDDSGSDTSDGSGSTDGSSDDGSGSGSSGGTDTSAQLKRIAVKSKGGGVARYTFSASDSLRPASDAEGVVEDLTVSDRVGPSSGVDSYYYTGHITSFEIEGAEYADVYFADPDTGEKLGDVDPAVLDGNVISLQSASLPTIYQLSVTGSIAADAGALREIVFESSAAGRVEDEHDVDTFYFTGDLTEMKIRGNASVTFED